METHYHDCYDCGCRTPRGLIGGVHLCTLCFIKRDMKGLLSLEEVETYRKQREQEQMIKYSAVKKNG